MGKDRQEKKLKKSGKVQTDRDQNLHFGGAAELENAENARKRQR